MSHLSYGYVIVVDYFALMKHRSILKKYILWVWISEEVQLFLRIWKLRFFCLNDFLASITSPAEKVMIRVGMMFVYIMYTTTALLLLCGFQNKTIFLLILAPKNMCTYSVCKEQSHLHWKCNFRQNHNGGYNMSVIYTYYVYWISL